MPPADTVKTGAIEFCVGSETFKTWYAAIGDLKISKLRPLVVLHGGPGISHHYMLPHFDLFELYGIPTIIYDQIGIGRSSHPVGKDASFWTVDLFMDELENLLEYFGIRENFDLLGHSWGGMLAAQFAAARQPSGLNRLIIVSSPASMELWGTATNALLERFPPEFVEMLRKHEADGTTDAKEYQDGMQIFYSKHVCTINPFPKVLQESFNAMSDDPTVYSTMIGPSEFNVTGTLMPWSIIDILHRIQVPTLITNGKNDEAQDICVLPFFQKISKVKWVKFSESHIAFLEEPEWYLRVIGEFLVAAM